MALAKNRRLSSFEIRRAIKTGKAFDSNFFWIKFFPILSSRAPSVSRFAIIVSSKILKGAVERNKVKRKTGEAIRSLIAGIKPGLIVISVKKQALDKKTSDLRDDLSRVFYRISQ